MPRKLSFDLLRLDVAVREALLRSRDRYLLTDSIVEELARAAFYRRWDGAMVEAWAAAKSSTGDRLEIPKTPVPRPLSIDPFSSWAFAELGLRNWGRKDSRTEKPRPKEEWIATVVEPVIDRELFVDLVQSIRAERDLDKNPGRQSSSPLLLARLVRCGIAGLAVGLAIAGCTGSIGETGGAGNGSGRPGSTSTGTGGTSTGTGMPPGAGFVAQPSSLRRLTIPQYVNAIHDRLRGHRGLIHREKFVDARGRTGHERTN